jgi:hypothetical protein
VEKQVNLDYVASQHAQKIVKDVHEKNKNMKDLYNVSTKALGVLQEQGVYAVILFLLSRSKQELIVSKSICESLYTVLRKVPHVEEKVGISLSEMEPENVLDIFSDITNKMDVLLLVRALYEKILVYTRYGAKAAEKEESDENVE